MKNPEGGKIVFVNQATGYLAIDIINAFAAHSRYKEIALITGSIREQNVSLSPTVKWSKIVKYRRSSLFGKALSWLTGTLQIFFLLFFKYRGYEIFYFTVPPFAYLSSLLLPHRFTVLVLDVFPDALKIFNVKKTSLVYKLWASWNCKLFKKAHRIFTIGEGMASLLAAYVPKEKVEIIPPWSGLAQAQRVEKQENRWLKNLGLTNKFIVMYSGNMGQSHNIGMLAELARELSNEAEVHFLLIGRGRGVELIRRLIKKWGLTNCTLLPFQPDGVLNESLSAADLGIVLVDEKTAAVSLPSKIFNLQAMAVPILGISSPDSELGRHLSKHNSGRCFHPSDMEGMVKFVKDMKDHLPERLKLSGNAKKASQFCTVENAKRCYQLYISQPC